LQGVAVGSAELGRHCAFHKPLLPAKWSPWASTAHSAGSGQAVGGSAPELVQQVAQPRLDHIVGDLAAALRKGEGQKMLVPLGHSRCKSGRERQCARVVGVSICPMASIPLHAQPPAVPDSRSPLRRWLRCAPPLHWLHRRRRSCCAACPPTCRRGSTCRTCRGK